MTGQKTEQKIEFNKKSTFLDIIKNYILLAIGITYFIYYFSPKYAGLITYIKENIVYGGLILEYLNAVMAFLTVIGLIGAINRVLKTVLENIVTKTDNNIDNIFVEYLIKFIRTNKYFIGTYVFFRFISLSEINLNYVNKSFFIIFLIIFIYFLTSFLNVAFEQYLIKKTRFKSLNKNLLSFAKKIIIVGTWIIGIITILSNLGYNVTALITGAGIGGLAIALAAQKTLSNVFGAITVLLTKPFKIGDFVRIDGQVGTIKEMGISHLTMVDKEGYFVLIPNEKLISNNIENLTKRETRRTQFVLGVEYGTTLLKMKKGIEIIENILTEYQESDSIENFRVHFDNFGDFSLNIEITYYSLLNESYLEYVKQKGEINLKIKEAFSKAKIEMAFPTQEVIIKK